MKTGKKFSLIITGLFVNKLYLKKDENRELSGWHVLGQNFVFSEIRENTEYFLKIIKIYFWVISDDFFDDETDDFFNAINFFNSEGSATDPLRFGMNGEMINYKYVMLNNIKIYEYKFILLFGNI